MQSVLNGQQQFQYGSASQFNMGWDMGVQRGASMFLGQPAFGPPLGGAMYGDFSLNMLSQMMNNFMQGGHQFQPQCPCHQQTGLYQPYHNMPYGPRPQHGGHHHHQPMHGRHRHRPTPRFERHRPHFHHHHHHHHGAQARQKPGVNQVKVEKWQKGSKGRNDSLESILKNQGFSLSEIYKKDGKGDTLLNKVARANKLTDANKIQAGQTLNVPNSKEGLGMMEIPEYKPAPKTDPVHNGGKKAQPKTESKKPYPKTQTKKYDPTKDAGALHKAMNSGITGLGTDEEAIMKTLRGKSKEEIAALKANYKDHYGRELMDDLKGDLNKSELKQATDLMKGDTSKADARLLKDATSGMTDDEDAVMKTLKGKTKEERAAIQKEYKAMTGKDLDKTLKSRFSKKEYDQASALLNGNDAKADASKIRDATSGLTDDESAVYKTLEGKSAEERAAIQKEYKALTGKDLKDTIGKRFDKTEKTRALSLLDGNNAKADAAKIHEAMKGIGTDEKSINETLAGKSKEERDAIVKAYKDEYKIDLDTRLTQDLKGNDLEHTRTLIKDGKISDAKGLKYAMEGIGTDEAKVKELLKGKSKEEIAQLRKDYKAETGRDLQADVKSELGGRDEFDAGQSLKGKATTAEEKLQRLNERHAFERKGIGNAISNSVMDKLSSKGELLDKNTARANEANERYQKAKAEGRMEDAKAEKARLDQLMGYGNQDVDTYQEAKDSAADAAGTVAATAAAVVVTVGTAGAGAPLMATALYAGGAGALARTATTAAISGTSYDAQNLGSDAATGFVDGATTVLGAGLGRSAAAAAKGTKFGGGRVTQVAIEGAVDGVVGGAAGGGATEALRDGTWDNGFKEGMKRVGMTTALGAGMGGVAGGGMGSVMAGGPLIAKGARKAVDGTVDVVRKGGQAIGEVVQQGGKAIDDIAKKGGQVMDDFVQQGGKALDDIGKRGGKKLSDLGEAGKKIWSQAKDLDAKGREALKKALDSGDGSGLAGKAKELFEQASSKIKNFDPSSVGGIKQLKDQFGVDFNKLGERGKKLWSQVKDLDARSQAAFKKAFDSGDGSSLTGKAKELFEQARGSVDSQAFRSGYAQKGWDVKGPRKQMKPGDMHGREVAFRTKDLETGKMVEHKGILRVSGDANESAIFKIDGVKREFNNNFIDDLAVNRTFDKGFQQKGWDIKTARNRNEMTPSNLNGKEVAFRAKDPKTGKLVEHRGVLKASDDQFSSTFRLEGQKGEFNNNFIDELAVNPKTPKKPVAEPVTPKKVDEPPKKPVDEPVAPPAGPAKPTGGEPKVTGDDIPFADRFDKTGWKHKERNSLEFYPSKLKGREVVFRVKDPKTGKMVEHRGVLDVDPANGPDSALFTLKGQKGEFNNNAVKEMVVKRTEIAGGKLRPELDLEADKLVQKQAMEKLASFSDVQLSNRFKRLENFSSLEPKQRLQVLELAKKHESKELFGGLFGGKSANKVEANLAKLVREGKMGQVDANGVSLIDNLTKLDKTKLATGLDSAKYFDEVLETVSTPGTISQGRRGTCSATSCQYVHASSDPSDYVRVATGLGGESGEVTLKSGRPMVREKTGLAPDNSGRRSADRIYQSTAMNHVEGTYDNTVKGGGGTGGFVNSKGEYVSDGLTSSTANKILEDLSGVEKVDVHVKAGEMTETQMGQFELAVRNGSKTKQPVHVGLKWGEMGDVHSGHAVTVERMDDEFVYIRNPWGGKDGAAGSPRSALRREALDNEGRSRVRKADFFERLTSFQVDPSTEALVGMRLRTSGLMDGKAGGLEKYADSVMKLPGVEVPPGRVAEFREALGAKLKNYDLNNDTMLQSDFSKLTKEVSEWATNF